MPRHKIRDTTVQMVPVEIRSSVTQAPQLATLLRDLSSDSKTRQSGSQQPRSHDSSNTRVADSNPVSEAIFFVLSCDGRGPVMI